MEDPNVNEFIFVETGMLKLLPEGGRVVAAGVIIVADVVIAADVVTVNVGKENDERVEEGTNEAVVAEPEETPKVNDVDGPEDDKLDGPGDDNTKGCSIKSKAFVEQKPASNLHILIKFYEYDKSVKDTNSNIFKQSDTRTLSYCWQRIYLRNFTKAETWCQSAR